MRSYGQIPQRDHRPTASTLVFPPHVVLLGVPTVTHQNNRADPPLSDTNVSESRRHARHIHNWALLRRPKRFIAYLIVMEILAVPGFTVAFLHAPTPTGADWIAFTILAVGATVHIQLTQRQEERRRNRTMTVLIDLIAVWVFPAVLVIPATLTVLLVALIRLQRWFTARRPVHNFVFSSISHGLAAALANLVYIEMGPADWNAVSLLGSIREFALVLVAAVIYEGVQMVYVGGILALSTEQPTLRNVLGSKADNLLEAITTGLGAVTAVLLVTMPPAVAIMAVVTVVFNRLAELDQLQDDAVTDSKTQLLNMRGWSESAERAFHRVSRGGGQLAVLMIDLDHFKWINDTFGHPAGDDVLNHVSHTIRDTVRPADIVGRFGGEEFLVLLPNVDTTTARTAAERIRDTVAGLHVITTDKRGAKTTISGRTTSIGIAVFPEHGHTVRELTQAADSAVYQAKEAGRDRVCIAESDL